MKAAQTIPIRISARPRSAPRRALIVNGTRRTVHSHLRDSASSPSQFALRRSVPLHHAPFVSAKADGRRYNSSLAAASEAQSSSDDPTILQARRPEEGASFLHYIALHSIMLTFQLLPFRSLPHPHPLSPPNFLVHRLPDHADQYRC